MAVGANRLFEIGTNYYGNREIKRYNYDEGSNVNTVIYLPGNKSVALIGKGLNIYSLIDNSVLKSINLNSFYSYMDMKNKRLIIANGKHFEFYSPIRHWHKLN